MSVTLATAAIAAVFSLGSSADTTLSVPRGMDLQIANFAGEVTVRTWEKGAVRIQTESEANDRVYVKQADGTLLIKAYSKRAAQHTVDLVITAPSWMDLVVSGVHTDVDIEGTKGRVRVDTVHGDIVVVGGRGKIELNAINEDIHLTDASGVVFSETVNGDLTLQRITSDSVFVSTVNGEIFYDGTIRDRGTYQFASHNGDIAIALPKTANATVNVSTFSGEFASDFPVMLSETRPGRRFCFTIGKGGAQVLLESFQGTIHIFRPGTRGPGENSNSDSDSNSDSNSDSDSDEDDE
jgi:DUF4097 and DUF4098 domain-containing protein YvlB